MDGYFFTSLYLSFGGNPDFSVYHVRFSVRAAGMINVSSKIVSAAAINRVLFIKRKQILSCIACGFLIGNPLADVLDNSGALWNI